MGGGRVNDSARENEGARRRRAALYGVFLLVSMQSVFINATCLSVKSLGSARWWADAAGAAPSARIVKKTITSAAWRRSAPPQDDKR